MFDLINFPHHPLLGRLPPSQKHHAVRPRLGHRIDDLLGKRFPALASVAICRACLHGETRIQHQDAALGPGGKEAASLWGIFEIWIILFDGRVDVSERWGRGLGGPHREAESVGFFGVVVGILA